MLISHDNVTCICMTICLQMGTELVEILPGANTANSTCSHDEMPHSQELRPWLSLPHSKGGHLDFSHDPWCHRVLGHKGYLGTQVKPLILQRPGSRRGLR